ncbi:SHOCT domain-containing protein [Gordonia sp. ABSL49_1]|uniref:SHOCT domain-containing protein n=1 Tax=unclassified Gordonia (in: high G+C Gram-positive bacteria) TaxID=2657482 RepID=UPI001F0F6C24|nr:SHOCT domain-containing protein [Gordonia sp. ABSL49_1]MCH5645499.1 SHOCT domain-containing protein [Gordonia sp. ABSL49_1]
MGLFGDSGPNPRRSGLAGMFSGGLSDIASSLTQAVQQSGGTAAQHLAMRPTSCVAMAEIMSMTQTGMQVNHQPMMVLGVRVQGDGIAAFDAEKRTVVPLFQQALLHQRRLVVVVDAATREFEIDWQGTSLLAGSVPARFTSAEDGRTYDITGQAEPLLAILQVLHRYRIPVSGSIDLRSNPQARAEVMEVVRGYRAGGGRDAGDDDDRSVEERLTELEGLRQRGLISDDEYSQTRHRILGSL